jgi:nitrogen fixation protein NifU and related proteins
VLRLSARIVDGRISGIKFLSQGCVPAIACGSAVSELAKGKTIAQANALTRGELMEMLGELPEASSHAVALAMDALRKLLKSLESTVTSGQG